MLKIRILSGIVALGIILPIIIAGNVWFNILLTLAMAVGLWEFFSMTLSQTSQVLKTAMALAGTVFFRILIPYFNAFHLMAISVLGFFMLILLFLLYEKDLKKIPPFLGMCFLGFFYVGFLLLHLSYLRQLPHGALFIFWILASTFVGDSGAYFTGRAIGKHPLIAHVSPGKTWEGLAGQIIWAFLGSLAFWALLSHSWSSFVNALVIGLLCGILGPIGDLWESVLKRANGVKDSGHIMPGHGGLLDRIDSLLFTAPAVYYYMVWIA